MRRSVLVVLCSALGLLLTACGGESAPSPAAQQTLAGGASVPALSLTSAVFVPNASIPSQYTCDGDGGSPPLSWSGAPGTTAAYALVVEDPDAPRGVFTHWLLYDLPADAHELPANVPVADRPPVGGVQGRNDSGKNGYAGPCPPLGSPHRYRFTLYALSATTNLQPGASKQQVLDAIPGHIVGQAELVGTYQRQAR